MPKRLFFNFGGYVFFFARRYLWPKKKQVSVSLIGVLSVIVITTVVWLLLLFLSVTEGIERTWLDKLTSLNAPIRITPTEHYYNSYYYQIDRLSSRSDYTYKNIKEKLQTLSSDPYQPDQDEELPVYLPTAEKTPDGDFLDPVKELYLLFDHLREKYPTLVAEDYEVAGTLMKLRLLKENAPSSYPQVQESFLSQASYVSTIAKKSPFFLKLIQPPTAKDISHLLFLASLKNGSAPSDSIAAILSHIDIKKAHLAKEESPIPLHLFPEATPFDAYLFEQNGVPTALYLPIEEGKKREPRGQKGVMKVEKGALFFEQGGISKNLPSTLPIFSMEDLPLHITSAKKTTLASDLTFPVKGSLQGHDLQGSLSWKHLVLDQVDIEREFTLPPSPAPPWVYYVNHKLILPSSGILLPRSLKEAGVSIGDTGDLSYQAAGVVASHEQRLPAYVAGFYDPGVMSVGAKCLLASDDFVHEMNASSQNVALDPLMTNGVGLWFESIKETQKITNDLQELMKESGIDQFWQITPFYEYDFAKELMVQFQSDRYLFMLVGILILSVACSNIVSLLLILVKDKRHEIGVLLSLGARKRDIATIFGLCGLILGLVSSFLGIFLAYETLLHIDLFVDFLSALEGQSAFSTTFYGEHLPNEMSKTALLFVLIMAPILSLLAGFLPAIKACLLKPSEILRGLE